MKLNLYQVDAFANKLFSGNPAAVIPLQQWPDDALLQAIALENNLSETVFFVPSTTKGAEYYLLYLDLIKMNCGLILKAAC
jgi:PhzF family phenazine biosynthesis protein